MSQRRPSIQVSIEAVLKAQNLLDEFKPGFHIRLFNDPFMPLEIRVAPRLVYVAHTYEEDSHRRFDPRITFFLPSWAPYEVRMDPVDRTTTYIAGDHNSRAHFKQHVMPLVKVWARNLKRQGWTDPNRVTCEKFHGD